MSFGKKGKLIPHFVSPYRIVRGVCKIEYALVLQNVFALVNPLFHVSMLKECVGDLSSTILEG